MISWIEKHYTVFLQIILSGIYYYSSFTLPSYPLRGADSIFFTSLFESITNRYLFITHTFILTVVPPERVKHGVMGAAFAF